MNYDDISNEELERELNRQGIKFKKISDDNYDYNNISDEDLERELTRNGIKFNKKQDGESSSWLSRLSNDPIEALANNPVTDEIINSRNQFVEAAKQAGTGISEFGQDLSNLPKTLLSALSLGRVNIPKSDINFAKLYGAQENPEGLINQGIRGGFRELPAFAGTSPLASGKYAIKSAEKLLPEAETFGRYAYEKLGNAVEKINPFGKNTFDPTLARAAEAAERGAASSFLKGEVPDESFNKASELGKAQLGLDALSKSASLGAKAIYKGIQAASEAPVAKKLLDNISSEIGKHLPKKLEAFKTSLGRHEDIAKRESNAWDNVEKIASDSNIPPEIVKSELKPVLSNVEEKIKKYENDTSEKSKQIRDYLSRTKTDISNIKNYSDVFKLGKNLNDLYGSASSKESRMVISNIIKDYKEYVNKSLDNNKLTELKKEWNKANNLTKEKHDTFYDFTKKNGKAIKTEFSKIVNEYKKNPKNVVSPETFRKDFVPNISGKSREEGIDKFLKLQDITGNKKLTQEELIKSIFNYKNKKIDSKDFLNTYGKLSQEQRNYLFDDKSNRILGALENLKNANPDSLNDLYIKRIINDTILKLGREVGKYAQKIKPLNKRLEEDLVKKYSGESITKPNKEKNKLSEDLKRAVKSYISSNQ